MPPQKNLLEKLLIKYQLKENATVTFLTSTTATEMVPPPKCLHVSDPRENHYLQKDTPSHTVFSSALSKQNSTESAVQIPNTTNLFYKKS